MIEVNNKVNTQYEKHICHWQSPVEQSSKQSQCKHIYTNPRGAKIPRGLSKQLEEMPQNCFFVTRLLQWYAMTARATMGWAAAVLAAPSCFTSGVTVLSIPHSILAADELQAARGSMVTTETRASTTLFFPKDQLWIHPLSQMVRYLV